MKKSPNEIRKYQKFQRDTRREIDKWIKKRAESDRKKNLKER